MIMHVLSWLYFEPQGKLSFLIIPAPYPPWSSLQHCLCELPGEENPFAVEKQGYKSGKFGLIVTASIHVPRIYLP